MTAFIFQASHVTAAHDDWKAAVPRQYKSDVDTYVTGRLHDDATKLLGFVPPSQGDFQGLGFFQLDWNEWPIEAGVMVVLNSDQGCKMAYHEAYWMETRLNDFIESYDAQKVQQWYGRESFIFKCHINKAKLLQFWQKKGPKNRSAVEAKNVDDYVITNETADRHWAKHHGYGLFWRANCPCLNDRVEIKAGKAECINPGGRQAQLACLEINPQNTRRAIWPVRGGHKPETASSSRLESAMTETLTVFLTADVFMANAYSDVNY